MSYSNLTSTERSIITSLRNQPNQTFSDLRKSTGEKSAKRLYRSIRTLFLSDEITAWKPNGGEIVHDLQRRTVDRPARKPGSFFTFLEPKS